MTVTPPRFIKSNLIIHSYKVYSYSARGTELQYTRPILTFALSIMRTFNNENHLLLMKENKHFLSIRIHVPRMFDVRYRGKLVLDLFYPLLTFFKRLKFYILFCYFAIVTLLTL